MGKHHQLNFDSIRPKLKKYQATIGDTKLIIEKTEDTSQIVFPKEYNNFISLFDGEHSIRQIIAEVYQNQGRVSFSALFTALRDLSKKGFLENTDIKPEALRLDNSVLEEDPSILMWPIVKLKLLPKINLQNFKSPILFWFFALTMLSVLILSFFHLPANIWSINISAFGKSIDDYYGIIGLIVATSLFFTIKNLIRGLLLIFSAGHFYETNLGLYPCGLFLEVNDDSIYSITNRRMVLTYKLISLVLPLIIVSFLALVLPGEILLNDLAIIAILLTFFDSDPYRKSELTKAFNFLYAEAQMKQVIPYLKNKSIIGLLTSSKDSENEWRYVVFSIFAIAWSLGFAVFGLMLFIQTIPTTIALIISTTGVKLFTSILILLFWALVFFYNLSDIFHTLGNNLINPIMRPLSALFHPGKKYRGKEFSSNNYQEYLQKGHFFSPLSPAARDMLAKHLLIKTIARGDKLIYQDGNAESFFLILKGQVKVDFIEDTGRSRSVITLGEYAVVGEMAILPKTKRSADVIALSDLIYLEIPANIIRNFAADDAPYAECFKKLLTRVEINKLISTAGIFKDFPAETMNTFLDAGELVIFPQGADVVTQGDTDKIFYLLVKGAVDVIKDGKSVAELGTGDFFGEIALIANVPRTATVRTLKECMFLGIDSENFWKILSENIELALYIEKIGQDRMNK